MRLRSLVLPALLAAPLLLPVSPAMGCIRFKKPGGAIPPGLREPKDPPTPPPTTTPTAPPTTTPSEPSKGPPPTTTPRPVDPPKPPVTTPDLGGGRQKVAEDFSTWETWWVLNRIEFFPHRYVKQIVSSEGPTPRGATPLAPNVVREKLWPTLLKLKDDKEVFVREASLITIGRVASDESLKAEARTILLAALKDPNHLVARAAALGLFYVADQASVWPMIAVAQDGKNESDVRSFTALTLTALNRQLAGSLLVKLVSADKDADFESVAAALMGLGFIPGPESARFLKSVYEDKKFREEHRAIALESFGRRGDFEEGWEILTKALDDKEISVRRSAAIALGVLDYRAPAEREIAQILAPYDAMDGATVPADVQAKVDELKKQVEDQKRKWNDPVRKMTKKLVTALQNDGDHFVCCMAAISLGRIAAAFDEPFAVKMIENDLKKERNTVREYEILALAIAKAPSAYETCSNAITGKNRQPTTRGAGMIGLGILGDPRANELLRTSLDNEDHPMLRGFAALALGMLGDEKSFGPVLSLLKTTNSPETMAECALAVALFGQKKGSDLLLKRLQDTTNGDVAAYTVYAMGLMKDRSKLDALVDIAKNHGNFFVQSAAVAAIGYVSSAEDYPMRHLMARGFNYQLNLNLLESYFYKL